MHPISYYKRNFFNTSIADIFRALDGKSRTGAFILTFCLIDHLTWLEFGHTKNQKEYFNKWVRKRLAPLYIFYREKGEELYSVRCALVHTYGPSNDMINQKYLGYLLNVERTGMHLQKINNGILRLCLYSLLTDVIYAAHLFFEELEKEKTPEIIERLSRQIIIINTDPPDLYKKMHQVLAVFDNPEDITLHSIRAEYTDKILCA